MFRIALKQESEIFIKFFLRGVFCLFFEGYRDIKRRGRGSKASPHPFAGSPPQAIAHHRALINGFGRDKCKTGKHHTVRARRYLKKNRFPTPSQTKERTKIFCALKTMNLNHTARRFRPFARLRARTRLPVGLAIRLRNPCARERLRFDG